MRFSSVVESLNLLSTQASPHHGIFALALCLLVPLPVDIRVTSELPLIVQTSG